VEILSRGVREIDGFSKVERCPNFVFLCDLCGGSLRSLRFNLLILLELNKKTLNARVAKETAQGTKSLHPSNQDTIAGGPVLVTVLALSPYIFD
jgi:hypothetical protein